MKKSVKKALTAIVTVLSLSTGMISTSLSAFASSTSWGVYNTVGGPAESRKYYDPAGFYVTSSTSSLKEKCTSYSSGQQPNGTPAYVSYVPYAIDNNGNVIYIVGTVYYHYGTSSEHTINLTNTVPANSTIYGSYSLNNYSGINTAIYGTIRN